MLCHATVVQGMIGYVVMMGVPSNCLLRVLDKVLWGRPNGKGRDPVTQCYLGCIDTAVMGQYC